MPIYETQAQERASSTTASEHHRRRRARVWSSSARACKVVHRSHSRSLIDQYSHASMHTHANADIYITCRGGGHTVSAPFAVVARVNPWPNTSMDLSSVDHRREQRCRSSLERAQSALQQQIRAGRRRRSISATAGASMCSRYNRHERARAVLHLARAWSLSGRRSVVVVCELRSRMSGWTRASATRGPPCSELYESCVK